ncbi:MAG: hypothetical protein AMJ62_06710 [Myxococcales bacterium SG8_38]|nr:MAG: hypothetical protein AMJ62_06710 [Myxococcales bacterium SG8_38]
MKAGVSGELEEAAIVVAPPVAVITRMVFDAAPAQAWSSLMFYEEIGARPPLYLRLLLPVPIRTEGKAAQVGNEAKCLYEGGYLLKRTTDIQPDQLYEFEVAEQRLSIGGGMRLSGGRYTLHALEDGRTEVSVETRYVSNKRPRWLWRPLEAMVCHWFHRYLLASMRRKAASG